MEILLLLIGHFICDYPLQGDFIAKYKAKYIDGKYNIFWYHCLTAHAFIHALPVALITGSVFASLIMIVTHWVIDYLKCQNHIGLNTDQFLHLIVVLSIGLYFI